MTTTAPTRFTDLTTRKMRPTLKHRPAVWECMLGTVYASDGHTTRYFDYDYAAAFAFAGITAEGDHDLRWDRTTGPFSVAGVTISRGQRVLYIRRSDR